MKKISNKIQWELLNKYKNQYIKQHQFPSFPRPYKDRMIPIMHGGYLMFIRNKYLFLGLINNLEEKNLYAAYAVLKSYWENVATFGYYYLKNSEYLMDNNKEEAFKFSRKMALGGRGFLTKEMVEKEGHTMKDFIVPRISEMMKYVDNNWKKELNSDISLLKELYDQQIAEGGHTTFLGLDIANRWLSDGSQLPDIKKSYDLEELSSLLNLSVLSTSVFFQYWNEFQKLNLNNKNL